MLNSWQSLPLAAKKKLKAELEAAITTKTRQEESKGRKASYLSFLRDSVPAGWTVDAPHIRLIAEHIDAVERGEIDRLAIHMPPRHAKTESVTVRYGVYTLQSHPAENVLITGYNERFARRLGRKARNVAVGRIQMDPAKQGADEWATSSGGVLMSRGVGSPPTGTGFRRIIIDDPIRRREDAESEIYREKVWDWYTDDLYTRLEPGGAIVLIMCLTGDTAVLMDNGTEKALRDVRKGDKVATYENGKLSVSTVQNWKNQGSDLVFTIGMKSGIIVKGNERHPFLVERDGYTEWVKIKNLKVGDRILKACRIGANGEASYVPKKDATNLRNAGDSATPITTKTCGQADIVHRQPTSSQGERHELKTATTLPLPNMKQCSRHKMESAPSVESRPERMCLHIGQTNYPSTTTTTQEKCEGFCATNVTGRSGTGEQRQDCFSPLSTFEIIPDVIVSITVSGYEDVFDVQIERTENFIANGLVSHNTLWHEDDIGARAIASEPGRWTVLKLPAIAESGDVLGRAEGEALWPDRYSLEALIRIRDVMAQNEGLRSWEALYQQNPTAKEGSFFKVTKLQYVDRLPEGLKSCRAWDQASTDGGGDFTAGVKVAGADASGLWYIADVNRGQWDTDRRNVEIRNTAERDGHSVTIRGAQDPGNAGVDAAKAFTRMLAGYKVKVVRASGDKTVRADPFSAQVNAGNVRIVRGPWNTAYVAELRGFPSGKNDDQVDGSSDGFNELATPSGWASSREALDELSSIYGYTK